MYDLMLGKDESGLRSLRSLASSRPCYSHFPCKLRVKHQQHRALRTRRVINAPPRPERAAPSRYPCLSVSVAVRPTARCGNITALCCWSVNEAGSGAVVCHSALLGSFDQLGLCCCLYASPTPRPCCGQIGQGCRNRLRLIRQALPCLPVAAGKPRWFRFLLLVKGCCFLLRVSALRRGSGSSGGTFFTESTPLTNRSINRVPAARSCGLSASASKRSALFWVLGRIPNKRRWQIVLLLHCLPVCKCLPFALLASFIFCSIPLRVLPRFNTSQAGHSDINSSECRS